jgi:hypothetical protein
MGVASEMKGIFGEKLELKAFTTDSEEAKGYEFKSATNVLFNNEWVPLEVATDKDGMQHYLSQRI